MSWQYSLHSREGCTAGCGEAAIETTGRGGGPEFWVVAEEADTEEACLATTLVAIAVAGVAITLMLFPAAVALHLAVPAGRLAAAIGLLGVALGAVKLLVAACGVAMRVRGLHQASVSPS